MWPCDISRGNHAQGCPKFFAICLDLFGRFSVGMCGNFAEYSVGWFEFGLKGSPLRGYGPESLRLRPKFPLFPLFVRSVLRMFSVPGAGSGEL
jgi:hypothetical protein